MNRPQAHGTCIHNSVTDQRYRASELARAFINAIVRLLSASYLPSRPSKRLEQLMSSTDPLRQAVTSYGVAPDVDPEPVNPPPPRRILARLYISHALSTWNSRMFEFGAVIFLASIFPGTLFYASCYALFRSAAGTLLSARVGHGVDHLERLSFIRSSIGK